MVAEEDSSLTNLQHKYSPTMPEVVEEMKKIWDISFPVAAMSLLNYLKNMTSVTCMGRLGSLELAGGALAVGFTNITGSSFINITNSTIGAGDDCVSISTGSLDVLVSGTHCGPGHGFSIGSLGKVKNEEEVRRIKFQNCTVNGADNGVRIKTWPTSPPSEASDITFEDILMINVSNPIIIDQEYCPSNSCNTTSASLVKLSNIEFKNIRGTYSSDFGVNLRCSSIVACENITLIDVNLNGTKTPKEKWEQEKFSTKGSLNGLAVYNSNFN
ncbi:hypothetical protein F2Q69_00056090 [Brassica cretica]|uniref:Glycoside hydrolase family 28 protein n=1 Tax=Brassica cretica TaxID=69181 RepID=A0A8S9N9G9_BRACR|nr:hypothetical protein F2Q69_00056090 [Brassica cretica]